MIAEGDQLRKSSRVTALSINEPLAWLRISEESRRLVSQDSLISDLEELKSRGLLKNVFETDKIYTGKFVRFAPGKVLVEAPDGWTVDTLRWNKRKLTGKPLYTKKGVHRREGVLFLYGNDLKFKLDSPRVHDIVPTVMSVMKLPVPDAIDGKSLLEVTEKESAPILNVAKSF
jgi:predicted AlkP superfamily phosphohydrolase/phosphomutase